MTLLPAFDPSTFSAFSRSPALDDQPDWSFSSKASEVGDRTSTTPASISLGNLNLAHTNYSSFATSQSSSTSTTKPSTPTATSPTTATSSPSLTNLTSSTSSSSSNCSTPSSSSASSVGSPFASSPSLSPISTSFFRPRANSLHSSVTSAYRYPSPALPSPPLPPLPVSFPPSPLSASSSPILSPASSSVPTPTIASVSIPHHTKLGGKWVFACRVVPVKPPRPDTTATGSGGGDGDAEGEVGEKSDVEKESEREREKTGKMEIAGTGKMGEREMYTVWRSWNDFVELSSRLATAFPYVPASSSPSSPVKSYSSSTDLPSSFYRQPPRLSKKLTLFITRSTLVQRQDDLDIFLRRLFEMPAVVTSSLLVKDFFRIKEGDLLTAGSSEDDDLIGNASNERTVIPNGNAGGATPSSGAGTLSRRPGLTVKHSTPDLRKLMVQQDMESLFDGSSVGRKTTLRPGLGSRSGTEIRDGAEEAFLRDSKYSSISTSSVGSNSTVTPASLGLNGLGKSDAGAGKSMGRSPLSATMFDPVNTELPTSPIDSPTSPASATPTTPSTPTNTPKRRTLRHFYSLQDIKKKASSSPPPPLPSPPISTSTMMSRSQTLPPPSSPIKSIPFPPSSIAMQVSKSQPTHASKYPSPTSPNSYQYPSRQRERAGSKSSFGSISSLDSSSASEGFGPMFRQAPSGRLESFDPRQSGAGAQARRPSLPSPASRQSQVKAHLGHSPASSFSSINSNSSRSQSWTTDEDGYGYGTTPRTPPTPQMEGTFADSGKYFVLGNGSIALNNKVPLPPFFPVPPSMSSVAMQSSHSADSTFSSPRHTPSHSRKSSLESRSRSGSLMASVRPHLDPILASPTTTASPRPSERSYVAFKLLHPEADLNFVLRLPRETTLEELRTQAVRKFAMSGSIRLDEGPWELEFDTRRGNLSPGLTTEKGIKERIQTQEEFENVLERTREREKVILVILQR